MPTLIIQLRDGASAFHQFAEQAVTIGRAVGNTIQIDDPSVAEHHAELSCRNGRYHLRAFEPPARTWVHGEEVAEAEIDEACTLRFGDIECVFKPDARTVPLEKVVPNVEPSAAAESDAVSQLMEQAREIAALIKERDAFKKENEKLLGKTTGMVRERELCGREIRRWWAQFERASQENENITSEVRVLRENAEQQARHLSAVMTDRDHVVQELTRLLSAPPVQPAVSDASAELLIKLETTQRRVDELLAERVETIVEKVTHGAQHDDGLIQAEHDLLKRELAQRNRHLSDVCDTLDATIAAHVAATARVASLMRELDKRDQRIAQLTARYEIYPRPTFSHLHRDGVALSHG